MIIAATLGSFQLKDLSAEYFWGSEAATQAIGVTNIDILEAAEDSTPSYTFLSSGYNQEAVYSGVIETIIGSTLTLSDLIGQYEEESYEDDVLAQEPHFLRLRDGQEEYNGLVFLVLANVENDVTIGLEANLVSQYFQAYDSIDIIKANTLAGMFGTGEDFHGEKGTPSIGDNILIWTTYGWKTYFYHNDKWQTFGTRSDQGGTIIYPDEGLIYQRKGTAPLTLSFSGYVPQFVQSYLPGSEGKFLMSNPFPVESKISDLIDVSSNWNKSQNSSQADYILAWSGSAWVSYYHDVNNWINLNTGQIDDHVFQSGESFFVVRADSVNAGYNKIVSPVLD
jgi:hypothetical protein